MTPTDMTTIKFVARLRGHMGALAGCRVVNTITFSDWDSAIDWRDKVNANPKADYTVMKIYRLQPCRWPSGCQNMATGQDAYCNTHRIAAQGDALGRLARGAE